MTPDAITGDRPTDTGRLSVVHMATIAKVLTQDGQAAVGPAVDAAGGETGAEFLALLAAATGVLPAPVAVAAPRTDAAPAGDGSSVGSDAEGVPAAGLVALVATDAPRLAPPGEVEVAQAAARRVSPRAELPTESPPFDAQPDPDMPPDPEMPPAPGEARSAPATTLPATASAVAVAVLHALQAGQRPAPHPSLSPPVAQPVADPVPAADVASQLADAVAEIVAAGTGEQGGPDGDGSVGPGIPGGAVARDAAASTAHLRTVPGTVGTPAWRQALGDEVSLMIERGVGAATLRLSPEHLGPVEVRIDFADDSTNVWFAASHADTRAALADALPRLRDMLASVGVNLGEAGVHRELAGEAGRHDGARRDAGPPAAGAGVDSGVVATRLDAGRGLVDEYA